jgi:hypothetical protein
MAVIGVVPWDTWIEANAEGHRVYKQVWHVYTNAVTDGPITAWSAAGLPGAGDSYSWESDSDAYAYCDPVPGVRLRERDKTEKVWELTYTFTTDQKRNRCSDQSIQNPINEPWKIRCSSVDWTMQPCVAYNEDHSAIVPVKSSSHEPLVGKQVEIFDGSRQLILMKNLTTLNEPVNKAYERSVNQDTVVLFGETYEPRTLWMRSIQAESAVYGTCTYYYPHVWTIDVDPETHDLRPADMGFRYLVGTDKDNPRHFKEIREEGSDEVIRSPRFLDGDGNLLEKGEAVVRLRFRYYNELDWSVFGFPTTPLGT